MTIPRYTRPQMAAVWSPETRFRIWFEIEAHAADAMAELGMIPKDAAKTIWQKAKRRNSMPRGSKRSNAKLSTTLSRFLPTLPRLSDRRRGLFIKA